MKTGLVAVALLGLLVAASAGAEDWPQFRGPARDAVSRESNLLESWPAQGPKLLWRSSDAGHGYGSVAVAGGRIYLIANRGLDNEFVSALDAKDGRQIWTARLGKVGNPDQQPSYPGARSTPTLDGHLLYALGSDGDLVCVESASGKESGAEACASISAVRRGSGPTRNPPWWTATA